MAEKITGKKLAKNVVISLIAQIISVLVSVVAGLIVPRFIDEIQYSYWRTFYIIVTLAYFSWGY